jgi:hypothetical protein
MLRCLGHRTDYESHRRQDEQPAVSPAMKVVIERSGGFAGLKKKRGERDGTALTPEQRAALQDLLRQDRPAPPPEPGGDQYVFKVTVEDDSGNKTISVPESIMPSVLANILAN